MDNVEGGPRPLVDNRQGKQQVYPVKLRSKVIDHIADRLSPSFEQEKARIQLELQRQDATYQEITKSISSGPVGSLMTRLEGPHGHEGDNQQDRVVNLSQADISVIKKNLTPPPLEAATSTRRVHDEMLDELDMKFDSARAATLGKNIAGRAKGIFGRIFNRGKNGTSSEA